MAHDEALIAPLRVRVAIDLGPHRVDMVDLLLEAGATVAEAIAHSGLQARHPGLDVAGYGVAVWGTLRAGGHRLRDRDRVELLRPLQVDPMEARRRRQGAQRGRR